VVKTPPTADNEIQAITGATITSRAVTKAVNEAREIYASALQ
jgi:electron transport complex protein RnfG